MGESRGRWGVPVAEVVLVAAVWASLQLAGTDPGTDQALLARDVPVLSDLPGFRSDAWFLPADELLGFVEISEGPFLMGSDPAVDPLAYSIEGWSDTEAQGTVDLPSFYMNQYEVTVAQYAAFVLATGHPVVEAATIRAPLAHPVTRVSWTDAVAYARWLDGELRSSSQTPQALADVFRDGGRIALPTEAQWAKAARGADGRVYPWGNEPRRDRANFGAAETLPVGSFDCPECPYGLADMSGNAWEWTRSPYQPYPYDEADDREGLDAEALWVMRGGAFNDNEQNVRAANRGGADPGARRPFIGFRVAITR
jgi:formylglycine-generating enzyme required for sulfatase activity